MDSDNDDKNNQTIVSNLQENIDSDSDDENNQTIVSNLQENIDSDSDEENTQAGGSINNSLQFQIINSIDIDYNDKEQLKEEQLNRLFGLAEKGNNSSREQVRKIYDKQEFFNNNFTVSEWLSKLLQPRNNSKLNQLISFSEMIFKDKEQGVETKTDDNNLNLNWIPSINKNLNISDTEKLIEGIMIYYGEMSQRPPLQHVVDTISLIRMYPNQPDMIAERLANYYSLDFLDDINYNYKNIEQKYNIINFKLMPSQVGIFLNTRNNEDNIRKNIYKHYI